MMAVIQMSDRERARLRTLIDLVDVTPSAVQGQRGFLRRRCGLLPTTVDFASPRRMLEWISVPAGSSTQAVARSYPFSGRIGGSVPSGSFYSGMAGARR
jgi:hypothetical protein